jgi:quercetin dioxygenase-like cupin family protein
MLTKILIGAVLATVAMSGAAGAQRLPVATQQTATIKRTPLQKFDVPGTNYETVIGIAEIVPNLNIGRHTHPGPESGYMLEGEMVLLVNGQPEKAVRVGESYQVPSGAIHDARTGPQGAKVIATTSSKKAKRSRHPRHESSAALRISSPFQAN